MCNGCNGCKDRRVEQGQQKIREAQERFGTTRVFEHMQCALDVARESVRYLNRSDRAAAFGLPDDVVRAHRAEAERRNRAAVRQAQAGLDALRDRRSDAAWGSLVDEVREGMARNGGAEFVNDMHANVRAFLVETDVDAETAVWAGGIADDLFARLSEDPLNGWADFLESWLNRAVEELQSPEMGRQNASPRTVITAICIASAYAGFAVGIIVCLIWGFCSWHMVLLLAMQAHILACIALDYLMASAGM